MNRLFLLIVLSLIFVDNSNSQYQYPSGVFCSCSPTTGIGNGSVAPNIAKLDFVKGILVRISWELCEPSDNEYNWSLIDGQISAAKSFGKKISLAISNGMGAPQWLYLNGAQRLISEIPYKDTIPIPWDSIYLEKWGDFVSELGRRYDNDTTIVLVYATNSSANGCEMQMPIKTTPTLDEAGYTDEKMIQSWEFCIDAFVNAFPKHIITNDFHPVNGSDEVSKSVFDYASNKYGEQYGANAWWWTQKNTTVYPAQYEILKNSAKSDFFTGIQVAHNHTKDSAKFGAGGLPVALELAISDGIYYWEIWNQDLLNPQFDSLLRAITNLKKEPDAVNDNLTTNDIRIVPNPANDYIEFNAGIQDFEPLQEIRFYNLFGERVNVIFLINSPSVRFDISDLPNGMYLLKIKNNYSKFIVLK
ncbi:MAG: T9SS type A sorting domain-containing protein [Bacteroidetes bacterium]|nr:T9SS type A sorting domain-containing protein [Bacteroidota bacterium]